MFQVCHCPGLRDIKKYRTIHDVKPQGCLLRQETYFIILYPQFSTIEKYDCQSNNERVISVSRKYG
ncbi:hypothetical protein Hanom_Chr11g01009871 [Helianthus anomalus]